VISASLLDISRAVAPPNEGAEMEYNPVVANNGREEGPSRNSGGSQ
jgi:hypothetical protein